MARISRSVCPRRPKSRTDYLHRKLLLCALARKDIGNAKEIFSSMSDMGKNETMSRFLMYKIAVRCGDTGLAAECLQTISSSTTTDPTILYACCLDAQNAGNKPQLLATLQLVLEKYGYGAPSGVHLPALLRLTISLMVHSIEEDCGPGTNFLASGNMVHKLCTIFEKGSPYPTSSICTTNARMKLRLL